MTGFAKFLFRRHHFQTRPPSLPLFSVRHCSSSSSYSPVKIQTLLSDEELISVNLLLPRLCETNHLPQAIKLIDTCLLANSRLNALSLPILIDRLCVEPDMAMAMGFLTRLKHCSHGRNVLVSVSKMLIAGYFKKHRFKEGVKVFDRLLRPDSPCVPDPSLFSMVIGELCRHGKLFEALRVLREMVVLSFVPSSNLQMQVFRSLLREAHVREARELNEVLRSLREGDLQVNAGVQRAIELLDRLVEAWRE